MAPKAYQAVRDGPWRQWVSGPINSDMLRFKLKEANGEPIFLNGCETFAIRLDNEQVWNVIDGWK